ncbi:unnamed protein product, partial [Mesorhabditis spiculigera]
MVLHPTDCEKPCEYQPAATYEDCVFLDISDPDGTIPFFTARRALSGPYAVFMDLEENLKADVTTEKPASDDSNIPSADSTANGTKGALSALHFHEIVLAEPKEAGNGRTRRQSDSPKKIRYPRCIDVDGLAADDRKRVEADVMLNCDKNIFVLFRNGDKSGLSIKPPVCQGNNDTRICANRYGSTTAPPPTETTTSPDLLSSGIIIIGIVAGAAVILLLLIIGIGIRCAMRKKKPVEEDVEKAESVIVFLGNIISGAPRALECFTMILAYKVLFPDQVFLIRGNHEDLDYIRPFGERVANRYYAREVFDMLHHFFKILPSAGLIDERILCMHGLMSLDLTPELLREGWEVSEKPTPYDDMTKHLRWNEPAKDVDGYAPNPYRDFGQQCGVKAIEEAMESFNVQFIIRGQQMMPNGVQSFDRLRLVTVFSSSFYGGNKNLGAILYVDPEKNAIKPIFILNINDDISTQEELNRKLDAGWAIDGYAVPPPKKDANDKKSS